MQKTLRALTPLSLFVRFLTMSGLGCLLCINPSFVQRFLHALCVTALFLNGLSAIAVSVFQKKEPHPHAFLSGAASVGFAVVLLIFPGILRGSVTFAVGLWSALVSAVQLGYVVQLYLTGEKGKLKFLLLGIISLFTAVLMMTNLTTGAALRWLAALFLILYGLWQLLDMVGVLINRNVESSFLLSRLRLKPPVLLTALLPSILLKKLRAQYEDLQNDIVLPKPKASKNTYDETLCVTFHLGENVAFGFGHVDVSFRGKTYSYGCYDEQSNRLFGLLSDGTFLVCNTQPYQQFCQLEENKVLVGFTLGLAKKDGDTLTSVIGQILNDECRPWTPPDRPEYRVGAKFYKVNRGKFAVYNALRTNCAAMAEILAAKSGLMLLPPNGFVTPGAYYDYLHTELCDPNSNVLCETVYGRNAGKAPTQNNERDASADKKAMIGISSPQP